MSPNWQEKREEALSKITSENPEIRAEGWRELQTNAHVYRLLFDEMQRQYLLNLLGAENEVRAFRAGLMGMLAIGPVAGAPPSGGGGGKGNRWQAEAGDLPLGEWLWDTFRERSAVFGITAEGFRRRDEDALIWLRGRLSLDGFPNTEFARVELEKSELEDRLFQAKYRSVCLVGRPGLFGDDALNRLVLEDSRYRFAVERRPRRLPPGKLDPQYHCILEYSGGVETSRFSTEEDESFRVDYGVVQRFTVPWPPGRLVVVVCAGASSLGTLGAAKWACCDLFHPTQAGHNTPLTVPKGTGPESRMEVLLRVRAPKTTAAWDGSRTQPLALHVDEYTWSHGDCEWQQTAPSVVEVVYDADVPVKILFDGEASRLRTGKEAFRIVVALAERVLRDGCHGVGLAELANDDTIWDNPNPNISAVQQKLRQVKSRHLRDALKIDTTNSTVHFNVEARVGQ